jgi:hypothetical protein
MIQADQQTMNGNQGEVQSPVIPDSYFTRIQPNHRFLATLRYKLVDLIRVWTRLPHWFEQFLEVLLTT